MMKKRSEATQVLRACCSKADPQTNKHTHMCMKIRSDRGDYNTLRSLARSVIRRTNKVQTASKTEISCTQQSVRPIVARSLIFLWPWCGCALYAKLSTAGSNGRNGGEHVLHCSVGLSASAAEALCCAVLCQRPIYTVAGALCSVVAITLRAMPSVTS